MKRSRHRATTHLVKKSIYSYNTRYRASSLESFCDSFAGSSVQRRRSHSRSHSCRSHSRNSTKISASRRQSKALSTLPPDVSSINLCTATSASQLLPYSTIQSESPDSVVKGLRQAADGHTDTGAQHSTPKIGNNREPEIKPRWNTNLQMLCAVAVQTPKSQRKKLNSSIKRFSLGNSDSIENSFDSSYGSPPNTCKKVVRCER